MSPAFRGAIALALLGLTAAAHPAAAQTTADYSTKVVNPFYVVEDQYTVTTDASSPTFNRPAVARTGTTTTFSNLSGLGTAVAYGSHSFTASQTATYKISTTTSGYGNVGGASNFLQLIYAPSFDPTDPLKNAGLAYIPTGDTAEYQVELGPNKNTDPKGNEINPNGTFTFVNAGYYNATDPDPTHDSLGTSTTTISRLDNGSTTFVPDASTRGVIGQASQTLHVSSAGTLTSFNSFSFAGLQQNGIGDLTATLTHDGISVNLFNQPDQFATPDNFGALAAFDPSQTYTFTDNGADLATVARDTVDSYAPDKEATYFPLIGGNYQSLGALSAFYGTSLAGDWTLSVKDNQVGDSASFLGFSFNASSAAPVPEASTGVSLAMACGLLGFVVLWKRRQSNTSSNV